MNQSYDAAQERAVWERVRAGRAGLCGDPAYDARPYQAQASRQEQPPCDNGSDNGCNSGCDNGCDNDCDNDCGHSCKVTAEDLLKWIGHEYEDACLYRHLAACLPRYARRCLLEMAKDEQCHARRLSGHYYVMTGCCPQTNTHFVPSHCPMEMLRRRYQEELDGMQAYMDAARCADGTLSELLEMLARDEARHSRMVMQLLECAC